MSTAHDDDALIRECLAGDRDAFDRLIRKYEQRAYQYAFRLARNSDEASDVVSDAFVRIYNALPNFRGQSAFATWLYRILTNCYLDARKKDKSSRLVSLDQGTDGEGAGTAHQFESPAPGPDAEAERNARDAAVQDALQQMPEYQQAMLVMFHVEGLTYEEIAAALDLPIGTVKSRLNRARIALRDHLASQAELFQIG